MDELTVLIDDEILEFSENEELTAQATEERPIMTTPIDEYSVVEGLLLVIVLFMVINWMKDLFKGVF